MRPTPRLTRLLIGLVLLSALTVFWPRLVPAVLVLDLLLVASALVDLLRTPAPAKAAVERDLPERVGLSQPLVRCLSIRLSRPARVAVEAFEEAPLSFAVQGRPEESWGECDRGVAQDGALELERTYRPELRGLHALGDLRLVVQGPWGLVARSAVLPGRQEVRVEPALVDLSRTLALAASDRLDLGSRRLRLRGGETEFESLREYVPGDEVRRVDWKAFARRGVPMVRELELERGQELLLLIDRGRRMRATSSEGENAGWTKLDWALDAALQLAAVALAKGDRVGLAVFERRLERWIAPARGGRQMQRLAGAVFDCLPSDADADLERALSELAARHRRGATIVVLSDVADPLSLPRQRRALHAVSRRHKLVFAALDDPDLRAASALAPDAARHPAVRAVAGDLLEERRAGLIALGVSGIRVLDALPADLAGPLLAAWLDARHARPAARGV